MHLVDRVMERQLDGPEPAWSSAAAPPGRERRPSARHHRGDRDRALKGLRFAWGEDLETDLVVVAAGIRPDVALAETAGIEVARAIVVDDAMRTSVPGVWAVGECVEHRGQIQGLWAPIREQARVAGASVAGLPAAFHGAVPVTRLKVAEIELFCAGAASAETDDDDELVTMDTRSGTYAKLVLRGERLLGAILLGDTTLGPRLAELLRTGAPVPAALLDVAGADASRQAA